MTPEQKQIAWDNLPIYKKMGRPQCVSKTPNGRCRQPATGDKTRCYYHDKINRHLMDRGKR
ncbi:MAG: hypothetical protein JRI26_11425 [Deltaproteobacteria bacterium]|nr:hypothetical protein [Deltaproteobacteria bacterium]